MTATKRTHLVLHFSIGTVSVAISVLADHMLGQPRDWGRLQSVGVVFGLLMILTGFLNEKLRIARLSTKLCLSLWSLLATVAIFEGVFRAVGFDFAREEEKWRKSPPFFRQPTVPTGSVFFRRPGPEQWTGQVLNTQLKLLNIRPNPYASEPVVTIHYNRSGFRNPDELAAWEIAVAGDSFTEMGYLPDEELFTTSLAKALDLRVLNLGTSYTGPLTHLSYLQDYGVCSGTRHAIIVFYEGNDLKDLDREYAELERWRRTGERDYRTFRKQTSFLRAAARLLQQSINRIDYATAFYKWRQGTVPVTLLDTPPGGAQISGETRQHLDYFFSQYAEFGKQHGLSLWLAYMPSKLRVLHGHLEFLDGAPVAVRSWTPTDLPQAISSLCDQFAVRFVDLTPALLAENKDHLVYNTIYDTHLNTFGSQAVARELARFIGQQSISADR